MASSERTLISIDADLHKLYGWCSACGRVCSNEPNHAAIAAHFTMHIRDASETIAPLMLFEIASPMAYRDGKAAHYNLAKWMIFNVATVVALAVPRHPSVLLVSPSSKWTLGYEAAARQKMAKADASNHDLRECQSMIAFYRMAPAQWVTLPDYLRDL